jgi:peptide/nickel transport system permease protein
MYSYILRRLLYNIPVYLGIIFLVMTALRVQDPVYAFLGKNASQEQYEQFQQSFGLDKPFLEQYVLFLKRIVTLDFTERSWEQQRPVGEIISASLPPTLMITVPSLVLTAAISIIIGLICAFRRGRPVDRGLMVLAVLGMSISYLVYIIIGQYFGAFWLTQQTGRVIFKVDGYDQNLSSAQFWLMNPTVAAQSWITYCALPVMIGVIVAMGYDTRFYRAVMVEETTRDYITTARAKGAPDRKIMFVHMLKNAMIPIITRVMITLPFLIEGSILVEMYFGIPGMGRTLITAINAKDFPIVQSVTAVFAGVVIITVILTDVLYALVDPRVRLR